jgi:hypothetical protein
MDKRQLEGLLFTGVIVIIVVRVVHYYRATPKGRQTWMTLDPKQQALGVLCLLSVVLWLGSRYLVRPWAAAIGFDGHWAIDVAPSLFAGFGATAYVAIILRLRPFAAFCYGAALMLLVEVIQLWLPNYVFDSHDLLAGLFGVVLVAMLLSLYSLRTRFAAVTSDAGESSTPMTHSAADSEDRGDDN